MKGVDGGDDGAGVMAEVKSLTDAVERATVEQTPCKHLCGGIVLRLSGMSLTYCYSPTEKHSAHFCHTYALLRNTEYSKLHKQHHIVIRIHKLSGGVPPIKMPVNAFICLLHLRCAYLIRRRVRKQMYY